MKARMIQLNPNFSTNIKDIYGTQGISWLEALPKLIQHFAKLWNFQFLHAMHDLSYNFVGLVRLANNQTAILKMSPGKDLIREMEWLGCIEKGVPKIYALDKSNSTYLMEHLEPGYSLKRLVKEGCDDEATQIICQTILNLQNQHCENLDFPHISDFIKDLKILVDKFDARLLSKAQSLFHDLTHNRSHDIALHGYLHHDNILSCASGWKIIDPHGYVGHPIAEIGAMFRNPLDCFPQHIPLPEVIERRLSIIAEMLPFDIQKVRDWAFCITVLSAAWSLESHGKVLDLETEVANALDQICL